MVILINTFEYNERKGWSWYLILKANDRYKLTRKRFPRGLEEVIYK